MNNIGERLKYLRKKTRMSQKELSNKIGFSRFSIIAWEKGESEPRKSEIDKLASALGVSVSYLMGETDDVGNLSPDAPESVGAVPDAPPDSIVFEYSEGNKKVKLVLSNNTPQEERRAVLEDAVYAVSLKDICTEDMAVLKLMKDMSPEEKRAMIDFLDKKKFKKSAG